MAVMVVYNSSSTDKKRILIVEDNKDMRNAISKFLESKDYEVSGFDTAENALLDLVDSHYDLILLDINLPGLSGFQFTEEFNKSTFENKPLIIAMTARDSVSDKLKGFDIGFTDYLVKPFDLRELLARIEAHLKRSNLAENKGELETKELKIGDYIINISKLEFKYKKELIQLTNIEFRIMTILLENHDLVVELDDLIEYVWGESLEISNPPIRIHIANLRKKIKDTDYSKIKTLPGKGYRLVT